MLVPTEVVGELMAQSALDLAGQQRPVVAKVPQERVAIDNDPILEGFSRDPVAEVLAVGAPLAAEVRDDHRDALEDPLELRRQGVDRIGDEGLERIWAYGFGHRRQR